MIMKRFLPSLIVCSIAIARASPVLRQQQIGRKLQGGTLETYYHIGMFSIGSKKCTFPPSVTFLIQCSGTTAVALDDDANLGLASCINVDSKTLQCTDDSLDADVGFDAQVIMKCVGDTESDLQVTVTLLEGTLDCSRRFLVSSGRFLSVLRLCAGGESVSPTKNCINSALSSSGSCQSRNACGGLDFPPCTSGMFLPAISAEVLDTTVPTGCLFRNDLVTLLPPLSDAPGNSAEYHVIVSAVGGASCGLEFPTKVSLTCGEEGNVGSIDFFPDSQALLDSGICQREGTSSIICHIFPPGQAYGFNAWASAFCTGASVEALAMSVEVEPGRMVCTVANPLTWVTYTASIRQFCTGVKSTPIGDYADLLAQHCSPWKSNVVETFDLDMDGNPDYATEICMNIHYNCLPDFYCQPDGSQQLGNIRARIPPFAVDVDCLVPREFQPTMDDPECTDDLDKTNLLFATRVKGKKRDCAWLSKSSKKVKNWYCQNVKKAQRKCAACAGGGGITEEPNRSILAYKVQKRNCEWLQTRNDIAKMCKLSEDAQNSCRKTCERCG